MLGGLGLLRSTVFCLGMSDLQGALLYVLFLEFLWVTEEDDD